MDTVDLLPRQLTWFDGWDTQPETVPIDLRDQVPGAQIILREWQEYRLSVPGALGLFVGNVSFTPFHPGSSHFSITISNRLGPTKITPVYPHGLGESLVAEVIAPKFGSIRESLGFMTNMVDELSGFAADLPFVVSAETLRQVQKGHGAPNKLFTFHYLRHNGDRLLKALQIINADPHRALTDVVEELRIDQAKRVDAETIRSLLRGPHAGEPSQEPSARLLDRLQPIRVDQRRPEETADTAENRFVVAALHRIRKVIAEIRCTTWWIQQANELDSARFILLDTTIRRTLLARPWNGISASISFPAHSRVLQQKPGYRDLTQFWNGLSQITEPILQQMDRAIDLRDVPTLYEYWLFFTLVHAFETSTKCKAGYSVVRDDSEISWSMEAHIAGHGSLLTQKTYGSYTPFAPRPDFVWESESGQKVVLDAKFAMSQLGELQADEHGATPSKATTRDIAKMHAYRDAIDGVQAAFVLFPGTRGAFWNAYDRRSRQKVDGIEDIIEQILNGQLDGIGAIPMSPMRGDI